VRKKIVLSLLSLALSLLFAEGALRIAGIARAGRGSEWFAGGNHPRFLFREDVRAGYALRPGFHGREINAQGDFRQQVAVDAAGLRREPHSAKEQPCALAVGDSMTFGEGVRDGETWPAVAERLAGVRVYNAGVPGYGTPQMVALLEELLPRLHPSVVFLAFSPRWDRDRTAQPFVYKAGYIVAQGYRDRLYEAGGNLYLAETKLPVLGALTAYAKRVSVVARLALPALGDTARRIVYRKLQEGPPEAHAYDATVESVLRAKALCDQANETLLVVLLLDDRGPDFTRDRLEIERRLLEKGIHAQAADEMPPKVDLKPKRFPHDGHWNAEGHAAFGAKVAEILKLAQWM
jgi:hypothetical protein